MTEENIAEKPIAAIAVEFHLDLENLSQPNNLEEKFLFDIGVTGMVISLLQSVLVKDVSLEQLHVRIIRVSLMQARIFCSGYFLSK